ncbi:MAG: 30S ribosomal protein S9 [Nitrospirota bacterium]
MTEKKVVPLRYTATGRRKRSIARVILTAGSGLIVVNGLPSAEYFPRPVWLLVLAQPFEASETVGQYDVKVNVCGGGLSGQAGATRHGISRALLTMAPTLRTSLKKEGLLTRDSREKERKKFGQKGARKKFQYSKR